MPMEGVEVAQHADILRYDELLAIVKAGINLGITKVKVTGGEPFVRKDVISFLRQLKEIPELDSVTVSTNGILLHPYIEELQNIGIDGINISLDSLSPKRYHELTGFDLVHTVLENIRKLIDVTSIPVKINAVPMNIGSIHTGTRDRMDLLSTFQQDPVHIRFIEMMPIGYGKQYQVVSEDIIKQEISEHFGELTPCYETLGNGPSSYYSLDGFAGKIGFISAVSHKFCETCNRVRLSSLGHLQTCLQYDEGCDLKSVLRGDQTQELTKVMEHAIYGKPKEHIFTVWQEAEKGRELYHTNQNIMSHIGG